LENAELGADRLHRTLEQLLLLARVEGSLSFDDGVQCTAEQVARLAIEDASHGDRERIDLQIPQRLSAACLEMPSALAIAALRNLLDNALRHSPATTQVVLRLRADAGRASFEVEDQGPGIAPDDLQQLTQRFWRNGPHAGCGLGLAIVQAIVQRCAGQLDFDNREGGLSVMLQLPLRTVATVSPGYGAPLPEVAGAGTRARSQTHEL
jgi:signal transduction histidine kinase